MFLIFSKNQLLFWLILCIILFVSTWLISGLDFIISCYLLLLGEFASFFFSRGFMCAAKVLLYALSSFFLVALRYKISSSGVFIVSHKFGYILASFSLNSKISLISIFFSYLFTLPLRRVLSSFHMNVAFLLFMLLLKIGCLGQFQYFCIRWGLICDQLYGQFWRSYHMVLRRSYILLFLDKMLYRYLLIPFIH